MQVVKVAAEAVLRLPPLALALPPAAAAPQQAAVGDPRRLPAALGLRLGVGCWHRPQQRGPRRRRPGARGRRQPVSEPARRAGERAVVAHQEVPVRQAAREGLHDPRVTAGARWWRGPPVGLAAPRRPALDQLVVPPARPRPLHPGAHGGGRRCRGGNCALRVPDHHHHRTSG